RDRPARGARRIACGRRPARGGAGASPGAGRAPAGPDRRRGGQPPAGRLPVRRLAARPALVRRRRGGAHGRGAARELAARPPRADAHGPHPLPRPSRSAMASPHPPSIIATHAAGAAHLCVRTRRAPPTRTPMLAQVSSGAVLGVDAYLVRVEVDIANGLPSMTVLWLAQSAVRYGREPVTS